MLGVLFAGYVSNLYFGFLTGMIELITAITSVVTFIGVIIALYNLKKYKEEVVDIKRDKRLKWDPKRILLEDDVYEATDKLVSSIGFDENKLLYNEKVDDIKLSEHVVDDSFFKSLNFNINEMEVKENNVTCLMPFHPKYNKMYRRIQWACVDADFVCKRSDDVYKPGDILQYTIELILKSQIIIGVLDGRNPNVFYELGIAHSIGKTVILISDEKAKKDIPFDLLSNRFIFYKSLDDLESKLNLALKSVRNDG